MKLPGWSPSTETSIRGKSPQFLEKPKMIQPRTMRFIPTENPADYMRLASAEAMKTTAMLGAVSKGLDVFASIHEADEKASANQAVAEYSKALSEYTVGVQTDKRLYVYEDQADGSKKKVYHWENAKDDYDMYAARLKEDVLRDRKFTTKEAQQILQIGFTRNDEQASRNILKYVGDRKIDRAREGIIETIDSAAEQGNILKIEEQVNLGIQTGAFDPVTMRNLGDRKKSYAATHNVFGELEFGTMQTAVNITNELQNNTTKRSQAMTDIQRQQGIRKAQGVIENKWAGDFARLHENGGSAAAWMALEELAGNGKESSQMIDDAGHMELVSRMSSHLNLLDRIEKEAYGGQESANYTEAFSIDMLNADPGTVTAVKNMYDLNPDARKSIDQAMAPISQLPSEEFYGNPEVDKFMTNAVIIDANVKPLMNRLETDLMSGDIRAIRKIRQLERGFAEDSIPLNDDARKRYEFYNTFDVTGQYDSKDPIGSRTKMVDMYGKISTDPNRQAITTGRVSEAYPKREDVTKAFNASIERMGIGEDDTISAKYSAISNDGYATHQWKKVVSDMLPYFNYNMELAEDYATKAISRSFGVTTSYGDSQVEYKSPEAMINSDSRIKGLPSEAINQQYDMQIIELNQVLEANNIGDRYTTKNVRRRWIDGGVNGQMAWELTDLEGKPIMSSPGKVAIVTYDDDYIIEADTRIKNYRNKLGESEYDEQMSVATSAGFEQYPFEDVSVNTVTGRIAPTITAAVKLNIERWNGLSEEQRTQHDAIYRQAFKEMYQENVVAMQNSIPEYSPQQIPKDFPPKVKAKVESKIHSFLSMRGYMRGDRHGIYIRPPVSFSGHYGVERKQIESLAP